MLKEEIVQAMDSKRYIPAELTDFVNFFDNYSKDEVLQAIDELKKDYTIMESNKGKLILAKTKGYFKGVVTGVFDDHIFVKIDKYDRDLKIEKKRHDIVLPKAYLLKSSKESQSNELSPLSNTIEERILKFVPLLNSQSIALYIESNAVTAPSYVLRSFLLSL
jgi:hypothetical protein